MRKSYSKDFKFKVAIEAIKGDLTIAEIMSRYQVPESVIHKWKKHLLDGGSGLFASKRGHGKQDETDLDQLHATIGRLKVENDFLEKALGLSPKTRGCK